MHKKGILNFNSEIYVQTDGITMGFSLRLVPGNIVMVELENSCIQRLETKIKMWKRYVDDTICFAKLDSTNLILTTLNSFQSNIKFNIEIEKKSAIPFLDVLVIKTPKLIHTTVYRKKTISDLYIHWNSFATNKWKRGTIT